MKYILGKAGGADHSTKEYALFRSRNHAWIVEGKHCAKRLGESSQGHVRHGARCESS